MDADITELNGLPAEGLLPRDSLPQTWKDMHSMVSEFRRKFGSLSVQTPSEFEFRRISNEVVRIYYLLCPGKQASIYYSDFHCNNTQETMAVEEVLDSSLSFSWKRTSKEEQLLSERKRCSVWGITSYSLERRSGLLVFPAVSNIFYGVHPAESSPENTLNPSEMPEGIVRINPALNYRRPNLIAFSANKDIYIFNTETKQEFRVTNYHTFGGSLVEYPVSAGVPSYVMQEEFSRYHGFWWQPRTTDGEIRLLFEVVDESEVLTMQFMTPEQTSATTEEFFFPRTGTKNASSHLYYSLLNADGSPRTEYHLTPSLKQIAPWHEYLVRVGWTPCGQFVWCQLLNRRQTRLDLMLLPLSLFQPMPSSPQQNSDTNPPPTSPNRQNGNEVHLPYTLVSENNDQLWVDVHDLLFWFGADRGTTRQFIFVSESSGYRHLYYYKVRLAGAGAVQVQQKVPLTSGDWNVLSSGMWVDEPNGLVYFMGLKDSPIEHHLYVIKLVTSDDKPLSVLGPQRLTQIGYTHAVYLDTSVRLFVSSYSSVSFIGTSELFSICDPVSAFDIVSVKKVAGNLGQHEQEGLQKIERLVPQIQQPEIIPVKHSDGTDLYTILFRPHNFDPNKKYPVVLHVYGGPQVQLITNSYKGSRYMRLHMLAANGICVVSVDGRGSENRGNKFQGYIKNRMGLVEIADQVLALEKLSEMHSFMDLNRVGVFGWSYGGYLSLMALAQRGDLFKVAVAGAPVVNWHLYDTGYTERYMDLPEFNVQGYRNSSVLNFIKDFPDEEGRLLIVQGLIDENVHFCHVSSLIQHLVHNNKPYQLQIYPRERHSLRQSDSNEHYETTLMHFLMKKLLYEPCTNKYVTRVEGAPPL